VGEEVRIKTRGRLAHVDLIEEIWERSVQDKHGSVANAYHPHAVLRWMSHVSHRTTAPVVEHLYRPVAGVRRASDLCDRDRDVLSN
jgi:hypothetical protein